MAAKLSPAERTPCVILVHGLWMHGIVFAIMRRALRRHGYCARAYSYRSVRVGLDENARALAAFITGLDLQQPPNVLGHSLGGVLALRAMALSPGLRLGRVVLMGSPVQGSRAARELQRWAPMAALLGRSIRDWQAIAPADWPLTAEVGVIAGDRSLGIAHLLGTVGRPNDGVVSLAETELAQARDRITLHCSHSEMLISRHAADVAAHFFRHGRFQAERLRARGA